MPIVLSPMSPLPDVGEVPSALRREGLSLFGPSTNTEEVFRMGTLDGRRWGGSSYLLPGGSHGVWGTREGVWLKSYTGLTYSNFSTKDIGGSNNPNMGVNRVTLVEDEVIPLEADLIVPAGRIILLEHSLYGASFVVGAPISKTASSVVLTSIHFRAAIDGGAVGSYLFLAGSEISTGYRAYSSVAVRCTWVAVFSPAIVWDASATYTFSRQLGLRMISHEVNLSPTLAGVSFTPAYSDVYPSGEVPGGGDGLDPGGGTGEQAGGEPP